MASKFCTNCGSEIPLDAKFCSRCGTAIAEDGTPEKPESASTSGLKSTKGRDIAIVVGILVVVAIGYFLLREPTQPPIPERQGAATDHPEVEGMDMEAAMSALSDLPEDYESLIDMGNKFMDEMNFPVAAECYKRALAIDGTSPNVRTDYGACLHGMGLPHRAKEEFQEVIEEHPNHAIAQFNLGIVYHDMQQLDSAKFYWQRYLQLDPDGPAATSAKHLLEQLNG